MRLLFIISLFLSPHLSAISAEEHSYQNQQFKSQSSQVSLIELFTSEGCSSCPPADEWMSALQTKKNLWSDFVPVAFHVDYWDYIGWKDVYAKPENGDRQRVYAQEYRESTVYTPGVRAEGKEWRNWRRANLEKLSSVERNQVGVLQLDVSSDGMFKAGFDLAEGVTLNQLNVKGEPYILTVALLGIGISTDVKRGENHGKTLNHDFIVLDSQDYEVKDSTWQGKLPVSKVNAQQYAIAAWVSSNKSIKPIQAVGGVLK